MALQFRKNSQQPSQSAPLPANNAEAQGGAPAPTPSRGRFGARQPQAAPAQGLQKWGGGQRRVSPHKVAALDKMLGGKGE